MLGREPHRGPGPASLLMRLFGLEGQPDAEAPGALGESVRPRRRPVTESAIITTDGHRGKPELIPRTGSTRLRCRVRRRARRKDVPGHIFPRGLAAPQSLIRGCVPATRSRFGRRAALGRAGGVSASGWCRARSPTYRARSVCRPQMPARRAPRAHSAARPLRAG